MKPLMEILMIAIHECYKEGEISDSTFDMVENEIGSDNANEFLKKHEVFIEWAAEQMESFRDKLVEAYIRGIQLSMKEIHEITALEPKTEP